MEPLNVFLPGSGTEQGTGDYGPMSKSHYLPGGMENWPLRFYFGPEPSISFRLSRMDESGTILESPLALQAVNNSWSLLPGFINTHVHNAFKKDNLQTRARQGVTTVR